MNVEVALGSVVGGFRVERLLGSGAMGAVYLAEDVHLKRKVAVKVLSHELAEDERFRRRFLLESRPGSSIRTSSPSTARAKSTTSSTLR